MQVEARNNIKTKVVLIEKWIKQGLPLAQDSNGNDLYKNDLPIFYKDMPKSIPMFRRWCDPLTGVTGTNENALNSFMSDLKGGMTKLELQALIDKLKIKQEEQEVAFTKKGLAYWEDLVKLKEKMISRQNDDISSLSIEVNDLKIDLQCEKEKINDLTEQMSIEINALTEQNKKLRERLERASSFKVVK